MVFITKFKFAPIFTMIFVIGASKYVGIRSSEGIGGQTYSELYPNFPIYFPKIQLFFQLLNQKYSFYVRFYLLYDLPNFEKKILCTLDTNI